MEIVSAMSDKHPILRWAEENGRTVPDIAAAAGCSDAHLRNICAGRKEASLGLAKRLSALSGGTVPMDAFLRPEDAEARP
jgi:transcriptional regulator with XRE-family HTH domain